MLDRRGVHKLSGACQKGIGDNTALYRRQRLRAGFHPLTNERLGEVRREHLQEEWELYAGALGEFPEDSLGDDLVDPVGGASSEA